MRYLSRHSLTATADALCVFWFTQKKGATSPFWTGCIFTDVLTLCLKYLIATKTLKENAKNNLN